jgi:hypothetical protein
MDPNVPGSSNPDPAGAGGPFARNPDGTLPDTWPGAKPGATQPGTQPGQPTAQPNQPGATTATQPTTRKVRMLRDEGGHTTGQEVDLPADEAQRLIDAHAAQAV